METEITDEHAFSVMLYGCGASQTLFLNRRKRRSQRNLVPF